MRIRHVVAADNVDVVGRVIAPEQARHAVLVGGHVADLSGPVDAATHLNRDFPDHRLTECIVVAALAIGAPVCTEEDGFVIAYVAPGHFRRFGAVNIGARRAVWPARNAP